MARECGWPGHVFQVVTGTGATGQALADEADFVMFTGSTRTGRAVAERAAGRLIPHTLELGGKDALIVLADAPLDRAVNLAVHGSLFNGGQACNAVERIYAEDAIYEAFTEAVRRRLQQLRTGPAGALGTVDVGAMTFPGQLGIIRRHLDDAVSRGARILTGGDIQGSPGRFVAPTLPVDVDHDMLCMREETFGPTLAVMRVRDADEAIRLANDSEYGSGRARRNSSPWPPGPPTSSTARRPAWCGLRSPARYPGGSSSAHCGIRSPNRNRISSTSGRHQSVLRMPRPSPRRSGRRPGSR